MTDQENEIYEKIISHFTSGDFQPEIEKARKEYEALVTPIRADEPSEGFILTCFHTWYLFKRALSGLQHTPFELVDLGRGLQVSAEERQVIHRWRSWVHSLFLIKNVGNDVLTLKDLWDGKQYRADAGPYGKLLREGEVLEARVYLFQEDPKEGKFFRKDVFHILPGICVHPADARPYIQKKVKEMIKADQKSALENFFFALQRCRLKHLRYANVQVGAIYSDQPLF